MDIDLRSNELGAAASASAKRTPANRRPGALVLLANGVTALVVAQLTTWFTVSVDDSGIAMLFGREPDMRVRTYGLAALSGSAVALFVCWALLLGLFVAAWARPAWRRLLLRAAVGMTGVAVILTFDLARAAVRLGSWYPNESPSVELASGAWLALFGVVLLGAAVVVIAAPVRVPEEPAHVRAAPVVAEPPAGQPTATPTIGYWSARPEWVPWWRRRGPVTGLVIGAVAIVLAAGTGIWLLTHRPGPPPDLRSFLVVAPLGSTLMELPGARDGQLGVDQVARLTDNPTAWSQRLRLAGVRQVAAVGWTGTDGTDVLIILIRCDADSAAMRLQGIDLLRAPLDPSITVSDVPGVPGAKAFASATPDGGGRMQVQSIVNSGNVVALVTVVQSPPLDLATINALTREQYDRL